MPQTPTLPADESTQHPLQAGDVRRVRVSPPSGRSKTATAGPTVLPARPAGRPMPRPDTDKPDQPDATDAPPADLPVKAKPKAEAKPDSVPAAAPPAGPGSSRTQLGYNKHVCPFCGTKRENAAGDCPHCGMADTDETRGATVARVGPWFLLQPRNPAAPGMRFSVLRGLVRAGQITAGSVVRGPATTQLWTYAARIRGLGVLFGICWSCNRRLPKLGPGESPEDFCIYCGALQEPPANPDQQLGAIETGESSGVTPSSLAGQTNPSLRPGGGIGNGIEVRERPDPAAVPGSSSQHGRPGGTPVQRRLNMPRPMPRSSDGGDALLSTRELATAFNLDRRRTLLGDLARWPWGRIVGALLTLALVIAALYLAATVLWDPITRNLGLPDDGNDAPAQVEPTP